jgi:hypothetical protein
VSLIDVAIPAGLVFNRSELAMSIGAPGPTGLSVSYFPYDSRSPLMFPHLEVLSASMDLRYEAWPDSAADQRVDLQP